MPTPTRARITATAVAVAITGALTGCTGPSPADQRDDVIAAAEALIGDLEQHSGLTDLEVVDDGTTATPCPPNGEHHRYLAYGSTIANRDTIAVEERMKNTANALRAAHLNHPVLGENFTQATTIEPDGAILFTRTVGASSGPLAGAALNADLVPLGDGTILVRIELTTVCR